jgi:hypothetical protein
MAKDKRNLKRIEQEGLVSLAESLSGPLRQAFQHAKYTPEDASYPSNFGQWQQHKLLNLILGLGAGEAKYGMDKLLKDLKEENIVSYIENLPEKVISQGEEFLPEGVVGRYSPGITPDVPDTAFVYRSPYNLSKIEGRPDSVFIDKGKMIKRLIHEAFLHGAGGRHGPGESTFTGDQSDYKIVENILAKNIASKGPLKAKKLTDFLDLDDEDIEVYKSGREYFGEDIFKESILSKLLKSTQTYHYRKPSPRH